MSREAPIIGSKTCPVISAAAEVPAKIYQGGGKGRVFIDQPQITLSAGAGSPPRFTGKTGLCGAEGEISRIYVVVIVLHILGRVTERYNIFNSFKTAPRHPLPPASYYPGGSS